MAKNQIVFYSRVKGGVASPGDKLRKNNYLNLNRKPYSENPKPAIYSRCCPECAQKASFPLLPVLTTVSKELLGHSANASSGRNF
jgi:hypothetical protein